MDALKRKDRRDALHQAASSNFGNLFSELSSCTSNDFARLEHRGVSYPVAATVQVALDANRNATFAAAVAQVHALSKSCYPIKRSLRPGSSPVA